MPLYKHCFTLADGTKKETKNWYYRFAYKGKTHIASTKTSNRKQAEKIEKKAYEDLIDKHELGVIESITLATAIQNYLSTNKDSGEYDNKVTYTNKIVGKKTNNHSKEREIQSIHGFDGTMLFEKLTNSDVSKLVMARKREGNKSGTILGELSVLSQVIQINRQLNVPTPTIDFKEIKKLNQLKPSKGKLRYLSKTEETSLLAELHPSKKMNGLFGETPETTIAQRQDVYDLVILLLDTGARYSEACNLTWDDIDLKEKTVNIYRNKVKNQSVLHHTKRLAEVLQSRFNSEDKDDKYVFTAKDGGPRKYSSRSFDSACRRAGIEGIGLHGLRHTFASRLVQKGISLYEVQSLLGHSSSATTQRYAHLVQNDAAAKAVKILNDC